MASDKTVSYPVRLPIELDADLQRAAELTGISKQDLMRLCMRIGLSDLKSAEHDLPGIVKNIADDKGVSFQQWADSKKVGQTSTHPCRHCNFHQHFPAEPTTPENCQHCSAAAAARSGYRRPLEPQRINDTTASDGDPQTHDLPQTETQEERLA